MASENEQGINRFLVVGASLYWAPTLILLLFKNTRLVSTVSYSTYESSLPPFLTPLFLAVFVGCAFLWHRKFDSLKSCRILAAATIVAGLMTMGFPLVSTFVPASLSGFFFFAQAAFRSFEIAGLLILWGLAFASLDKKTAGKTVILAALCTIFLYFAMLWLLQFMPQVYLMRGAYILSATFFLFKKVPCTSRNRTFRVSQKHNALRFYISRALFGLAIGLIEGISIASDMATSDFLLISGWVVLVGLLFAYVFSRDNLYTALPVFPIIVTGLIFLPFLFNGLEAIEGASVSMIWFSWIVLSSFQLSDLKDTYGMSELFICFSEKTVLTLFWCGGALLGTGVAGILSSGETMTAYFSVMIVYVLVLFATYSIFKLIYARNESELRHEMSRSREEHLETLYDGIAQRYGLSAREREVLEMLAQGYTRTYIKEQLVISDGTAKAHIAHVYQKLNIHKKDDLLQFIKDNEGDKGSVEHP